MIYPNSISIQLGKIQQAKLLATANWSFMLYLHTELVHGNTQSYLHPVRKCVPMSSFYNFYISRVNIVIITISVCIYLNTIKCCYIIGKELKVNKTPLLVLCYCGITHVNIYLKKDYSCTMLMILFCYKKSWQYLS